MSLIMQLSLIPRIILLFKESIYLVYFTFRSSCLKPSTGGGGKEFEVMAVHTAANSESLKIVRRSKLATTFPKKH